MMKMKRAVAFAIVCAAGLAASGASLREYVAAFNAADDETVTNAVPNAEAAEFLEANVPRFSCPDAEVERTYYFRWWTYRKHLRRGRAGWVVSEFLPNVSYAGPDNVISCPLGHHLMEGRWLHDPVFMRDYAKSWLKPDSRLNGPKSYVNWIVQGVLALEKVTGDRTLADGMLDGLVANYRAWEKGWSLVAYPTKDQHRVGLEPDGMFTDIDDREGTELTLSGNGRRTHVNAMMWGEATGLAEIARRNGRAALADEFARKAEALKKGVLERLWNKEKRFFTVLSDDGRLSDVCELHGYSPWYAGMPLKGYEAAWSRLTDEKGFSAPWGLTFPCRDTPGFVIAYTGHSCQWNGPSWPFATSVALTALANALDAGYDLPVGREDFAAAFVRYAKSHVMDRDDGVRVPWIDEVQDPFTGVWTSRAIQNGGRTNGPKHTAGKDYNHSTFCDLVITGLCGFRPRPDGRYEVKTALFRHVVFQDELKFGKSSYRKRSMKFDYSFDYVVVPYTLLMGRVRFVFENDVSAFEEGATITINDMMKVRDNGKTACVIGRQYLYEGNGNPQDFFKDNRPPKQKRTSPPKPKYVPPEMDNPYGISLPEE